MDDSLIFYICPTCFYASKVHDDGREHVLLAGFMKLSFEAGLLADPYPKCRTLVAYQSLFTAKEITTI